MRRSRREDVASVEGARYGGQHVVLVRDLDGLLDAAEAVRCHEEKAVVRPDVGPTVGAAESDGLAVGPDARVDDRDVDPDGHVGQRVREHERALKDVLRRNAVRDVDHVRVRRNALDHAAARAHEVVLETEVGQEGDEPARDAASLTAATRPSRSCVSASAATGMPSFLASADVTGPMDTAAVDAPVRA
jgi:hypothetical protein